VSNTGHLSTEETKRLTDLPTPARALAIGAHPDDVEFGCGATLAKWAESGAEVRLLVLTDGSKGTWDPDADLGALVATRRREQDGSAAVLGLAGVDFLGVPDGELGSGLAERALVCEVIDSSGALPRLRSPNGDDENGRGLQVVRQLSQRWGARRTTAGKVVWCEQLLPGRAGMEEPQPFH